MRGPSTRAAFARTPLRWCVLAGLAAAGCAQSPTELVVYTGPDPGVTIPPITSIMVTVTGAGAATTSRVFQSLGNATGDADIPQFAFPAVLDLQLTRDGITGPVQVDVAASDLTIDDTVLASGSITTTLTANKTTKVAVVLTATPGTSGTGGAGGAGAGGAAGATGAGGAAGGTGAGGSAGATGGGGAGGA